MSRLSVIDPGSASAAVEALFGRIWEETGMVHALLRVIAHSSAALGGYLAIQECLDAGVLDRRLRYQIALTVSQANDCEYGVAAYSAFGKAAGLSEEALRDARAASSPDRRADTALKFARVLGSPQGQAASNHLARLRNVGFNDADIVEIVAHAMVVNLANAIYRLSDVVVDFPAVDERDGREAR